MNKYTNENVLNELNELFVGEVKYTNEDEMNWYYTYESEQIKIRKSDYALHFRLNECDEWNYDFDLFN